MSYGHYLANLAGQKPPIRDGEPQCGYYKRKSGRKGPFEAAAIWMQGDEIVCRVGSEMRDPHKEWLWLARHPVAEADARYWFEHGHWPGEVAVAAPSPELATPENEPPAPTSDGRERSNAAEPSDYDLWLDRAQTLVMHTETWLREVKIDSEATAKVAANKIGDLRAHASKGKKQHEIEKAPHLAAGRAVDERYLPIVKALEAATSKIRIATEDFANAEKVRLAAEARRAEEARRQAEEEERRARGPAESASPPPPPPDPAPLVTSVKITSDTGRTISLRTRRVPVVTDHKAALKHFASHPDVQAVVAKLAAAAMKQGEAVPGCEWQEDSYVA